MIWSLAGEARIADRLLWQGAVEIGPGWTVLTGASGSGKTTLLRLLAGLPVAAQFAGRITRPERIGWMGQGAVMAPGARVGDEVRRIERLAGRRVAPGRVERLLEELGLGGFERRRVEGLSGGERQRVALARALLPEAPVMALDEPFSALDPVTRAQIHDLARRQLKGRAVILVTHDRAEAEALCDRGLEVVAGQIGARP